MARPLCKRCLKQNKLRASLGTTTLKTTCKHGSPPVVPQPKASDG